MALSVAQWHIRAATGQRLTGSKSASETCNKEDWKAIEVALKGEEKENDEFPRPQDGPKPRCIS